MERAVVTAAAGIDSGNVDLLGALQGQLVGGKWRGKHCANNSISPMTGLPDWANAAISGVEMAIPGLQTKVSASRKLAS